jgi:hypothetical protein
VDLTQWGPQACFAQNGTSTYVWPGELCVSPANCLPVAHVTHIPPAVGEKGRGRKRWQAACCPFAFGPVTDPGCVCCLAHRSSKALSKCPGPWSSLSTSSRPTWRPQHPQHSSCQPSRASAPRQAMLRAHSQQSMSMRGPLLQGCILCPLSLCIHPALHRALPVFPQGA